MKITPMTLAIVTGMNAHNAVVAKSRQIGKLKFEDYDGNRYTCSVWERPDGQLDCMVDFRGTPRHTGDFFRATRLPATANKAPNLVVLEAYAKACKYPTAIAKFAYSPAI